MYKNLGIRLHVRLPLTPSAHLPGPRWSPFLVSSPATAKTSTSKSKLCKQNTTSFKLPVRYVNKNKLTLSTLAVLRSTNSSALRPDSEFGTGPIPSSNLPAAPGQGTGVGELTRPHDDATYAPDSHVLHALLKRRYDCKG